MNRADITKELRDIKKNNRLKLSDLIDYSLINGELTLTINYPCVNMQNNENAFEGWAVVLKSAFGNRITKVILDVNANSEIDIKNGHCARFLWRAHNFSEIFDWFEIGNCKNEVNKFVKSISKNILLNIPSEDRKPVVNSKGERFIEYLFADRCRPFYDELKNLIDADEIFNQVPVGLFQNVISNYTKIFTGGASAIDLIGYKGQDILHLIELKIGDNNKLGIISEFLFYAFIMHNLFVSKDFEYPKKSFPKSFVKYSQLYENRPVGKINGYLLCQNYHPLLDKKEIKLLNSGLSKFNIELSRIKYDYNDDINNPVISNLKII